MGRVVATFFISLDGVVEDPSSWQGDVGSDALGAVLTANNDASDAFLMGRRLYDEWAAYWPTKTDDDYGGYINRIPKHVVSTQLTDPTWAGTTVISTADDVRRLQQSTDREIAMFGSATTVRWLLGEGLVDELVLIVHPVTVGTGDRLFDGVATRLELVCAEAIDKGLVVARYRPVLA